VTKLRTWIVVAVIAGIAVLIAGLYTFTFSVTDDGGIIGSIDFRSNPAILNLTNQDILTEARNLPEVQAFREKYPTAYEVIWREEESAFAKYVVERLRSGGPDSPIKESEALHLLVTFDSISRISFEYQCGATVTTENVLDKIKNTDCAD
jgi:hypothetical protein